MQFHWFVRKILQTIASLLLAHFAACSTSQDSVAEKQDATVPQDPHSFARPQEVVVTHADLNLVVDFDSKTIAGTASLHLDNKSGAHKLYLDSRDLDIQKVTLGAERTSAQYTLGAPVEFLGQPLEIAIAPQTEVVNIDYRTSPDAAAVQWLEPQQTSGGQHPFLFTQSQAILARTWIPCQDSPGIRMTYDAVVKVPPELMAVMSAENSTERQPDGVYEFKMPQPIPAYLIALAAGDLEFRAMGERTGVYAEPEVVDKAAWEFAETEQMIEAAEALYGPYRWGRYDIIVLPPSFPFGGMENPRLTFATPTILAGDRSLVALVAHELAHSWSGNLVTDATWNDFWLNEGFTTYFEHRIMEAVYGKKFERMLAQLELEALRKEIDDLGRESPDTHLYLNLAGRDPDEGMTAIAYDKGHFFLRMLEESFGRERWDAFLRGYFDRFAFQSMTTAGFLQYLDEQLIQGDESLKQQLQIDAWVYGPGLPDNVPRVESQALAQVDRQVKSFVAGQPAADLETEGWTTHHWLHFLRSLPESMSLEQMSDLDAAFHFTESGNSEVLHDWLLLAIANDYEAAYPALEDFLTRQGRRKFLKPLYAKLAETAEGKQMALEIYRKARPTYHTISVGTIDQILGWES